MKFLDIIAWILLIIGGLNWAMYGLINFDVIAAIFGVGTGLAMLSYGLVGLAAIYSICRAKSLCSSCKM